MQLTRAADYAVRVMVHLAGLPPATRPSRAALAEAAEVPEQFLSKVVQALSRARLISSHRGTAGGFELSANPTEVTLLDVMEAIEGPTRLNTCLFPGHGCERQSWCAAHLVWADAQRAMLAVLRRATIAQLAEQSAARRDLLERISG